MPEWVGPFIGIAVMILFLVFGSLKTRLNLPQGTPSWVFQAWWATAIVLIALLALIWLRARAPGDSSAIRGFVPWAMVLGYGVLILAGLYLWRRQRQRVVLRGAITLVVFSLAPPLVFFALKRTADPVVLAVLVSCSLILSALCLALINRAGRR